jgi:RND family efflux transporter MFP subunit
MNEKNIEPVEPEREEIVLVEKTRTVKREEKPKWKQKPAIIAASILAVVLLGLALIIWLNSGESGGAGKPVPAPRMTTMDEPSGETISTGQTITLTPEQIQSAGIKIETVGEQLTTETVSTAATGVVQANTYRETPAISLVGGIVRRVEPELGSTVARGQTLAVVFSDEFAEAQSRYLALLTQLNNARQNYARRERLVRINQPGRTEFEQATKQLKTAEAQLDEMRKRYQRTTRLVEIGASSREEFEQDTTKLRTAEAELEEARRRLERSKQLLEINPQTRSELEEAANTVRNTESELASVRQKLLLYGMSPQRVESLRSPSQINSEVAVTAPVSGTVTSRAVNPGEVVEANKELLRITDLSSVWVIAQVYEADLARLRTGSGASVTTDAYPNRLFRGQVTYIDPRLDEATRTAQVRVELDNPERALKLGMYVRVAFGALGQAEKTAPVVPTSAVQNIGNRQIVFVATSDPNVFELRPVRLGAESNERYTVLEGLNVGDKIVTEGSFMLRAEWLKTNQASAGGQ